jgi:hypothetical protein
MNKAIELHDSTIGRVSSGNAGRVELDFDQAYVHVSEGKPGTDCGTGWTQRAKMTLIGATITGGFPSLPCDLSDGELRSNDLVFNNMVPLPFSGAGVEFRMLFCSGDEVTITAAKAELCLQGEATYVEEVP